MNNSESQSLIPSEDEIQGKPWQKYQTNTKKSLLVNSKGYASGGKPLGGLEAITFLRNQIQLYEEMFDLEPIVFDTCEIKKLVCNNQRSFNEDLKDGHEEQKQGSQAAAVPSIQDIQNKGQDFSNSIRPRTNFWNQSSLNNSNSPSAQTPQNTVSIFKNQLRKIIPGNKAFKDALFSYEGESPASSTKKVIPDVTKSKFYPGNQGLQPKFQFRLQSLDEEEELKENDLSSDSQNHLNLQKESALIPAMSMAEVHMSTNEKKKNSQLSPAKKRKRFSQRKRSRYGFSSELQESSINQKLQSQQQEMSQSPSRHQTPRKNSLKKKKTCVKNTNKPELQHGKTVVEEEKKQKPKKESKDDLLLPISRKKVEDMEVEKRGSSMCNYSKQRKETECELVLERAKSFKNQEKFQIGGGSFPLMHQFSLKPQIKNHPTSKYGFNFRDPKLQMQYQDLFLNDQIERKKFEKEILNSLLLNPSFNKKNEKYVLKKQKQFSKQSESNNIFHLLEKKTIVFDMDETMIKSVYKQFLLQDYDECTCIQFLRKGFLKIFISFRPYLREMLNELKNDFELVVFTSGQKDYAHKVIDLIEKDEKYFDFRLVKDNCLHCEQLDLHVKDLKILLEGRELKDVIIVDNCTVNYMFQLTNGIPIKDYEGDKRDFYLYTLTKYLKTFKDVPDVRIKITDDFKINEIISAIQSMNP